jgi:hypothetical protein
MFRFIHPIIMNYDDTIANGTLHYKELLIILCLLVCDVNSSCSGLAF